MMKAVVGTVARLRSRRAVISACSIGSALLLTSCAPEHRLQPPVPLLVWHEPRPAAPRLPPPPDVPPSYLVLLPNADGTTGQVFLQSNQGRQTLNRPKQGADLVGGSNAFPVSDAQLKRDFGAVMAARPTLPERYRVYFAPGTSSLTAESTGVFNTIIQRSRMFSALEVLIVGHTDTRGEADVNYELGLRRARGLAEMLVAQGIQALSIEIGSEGENLPLVPTRDNTAEPRNRRVEVTLR